MAAFSIAWMGLGMNRRSFFTRLAGAVVAVKVATHLADVLPVVEEPLSLINDPVSLYFYGPPAWVSGDEFSRELISVMKFDRDGTRKLLK